MHPASVERYAPPMPVGRKKPAKPKSKVAKPKTPPSKVARASGDNRPRNSRKAVDKKFFAAIAKRNFAAAQRALDEGADINAPLDFGTVLIRALEDSRHEVIEWLLAQPTIDIDQGGRYSDPLDASLLGV